MSRAALASVFLVAACAAEPPTLGGDSSALASSPVRLVSTEAINWGCSSCWSMHATMVVGNIAFQKDVAIVYLLEGSSLWQEAPASFVRSLSPGVDVFDAHVEGNALRFAIRYRVAGQEYWDNNGGNDYRFAIDSNGATTIQPVRLASVEDFNWGCSSCNGIRVTIEVRNLAFEKDVAVVHSLGGGEWEEVNASYVSSPDSSVDLFEAEVRGPDIEYAIRYRVAGQEYWDNNGGANYHSEF